jgi:exopolysaccharide production protein ExoQ
MSATMTGIYAAPAEISAGNRDPFLFRRARTWWLLLALFLMAQENGLFTRQDSKYWALNGSRFESSPVFLMLTIALWLICAGLMFGHIRPTLRTMFKQKAVLAFPILALISICWSQDPSLTLRKAILLTLLSSFAWFFATSYSPGDQRRLLLALGFIVALSSITMALFLPVYGIASTGEWKGVFAQKNHLGLCMAFAFSSLPFYRFTNGLGLLKIVSLAVLPIGLILLSDSKTSLILVVVLVAVRIIGPLMVRARREQLAFILYSVFIGISAASFGATVGREMILPALGRDATLTGRTEHWALLGTFAIRHLWLGYGYHAFWTNHGDALSVMKAVGAGMTGSDSGYLDTLLQFGVVGIGAMVIILLVSFRDFLRLLRSPSVPLLAFWYAGLILMVYVGSVTEGLFPGSGGMSTFVFVLACASLRTLSEQCRFAGLAQGSKL